MAKIKALFDLENDKKPVIIEDVKMSNLKLNNESFLKKYKNDLLYKEKDYQKLQWHNERQMMCRFEMADRVVDFSKANSWLDIGCGTGDFFNFILDKYKIELVIGLDATDEFLDICKEKCKKHDINYILENFMTADPELLGDYDIVTLSGVLQNFDFDKLNLVFDKLTSLVAPGGQLWIDTLNYEYHTVNTRRKGGVWRFRDTELKNILERNGFIDVESYPFNLKPEITNTDECFLLYAYGKKTKSDGTN